MKKHLVYSATILCYFGLTGCGSVSETTYTPYQGFSYASIHDYPLSDNIPMTPTGYYPTREIHVPESYHLGAYHSPASHKVRDKDWIASQSPLNYTIQISEDEKAALVANRLTRVPKNQRVAEIRYFHDGKTYYRGLYGSYKTKEEAQMALDSLPAGIKEGALIRNFSHIQSTSVE